MRKLISLLVGCDVAGHAFPKPEPHEGAIVYLKRKLDSSCSACGTPYMQVFGR